MTNQTFTVKGGKRFFPKVELAEIMKETLLKGAVFRFQAKGHSMYPFIKDGDFITISHRKRNKAIRLGDIVAFIDPEKDRLVVHRVTQKLNDLYLIKGDFIALKCDLISSNNILGRVITIERDGRTFTIGLGPERVLIAIISRNYFLSHIINKISNLTQKFNKGKT